ncbi:hypothetical protein OAK19_02540 [Aureispira]|nr:hypothetical protein [Aureispira sp.]
MRHKLLLCLLLILFSVCSMHSQEFNAVWAKSIGWYNNEYASEMAIDINGNIWGVAYIDGPVDTINNMGLEDVYLFKSDSDGNVLFECSFGGGDKDRGYHLAIDEHNSCWVSGYFNDTMWIGSHYLVSKGYSDAFLIKFSSTGQLLWETNLGNTGFDQGKHLAIIANAVYWSGNFQGSIIIGNDTIQGNTTSDNYLIKMDTSGNFIWARQWGAPGIEDILGLNINSHDQVLVASLYSDAVFVNGDTLSGNTTGNTLLTKYDRFGNVVWNYTFGGISSGIDQDENDNIYLTGSYQNTISINGQQLIPFEEFDAFVLSLDSNAQFRWLCPLQGNDLIMSNNLLWNESRQELYVYGIYQGTIFYGNDSLERYTIGPSHINDDIFVLALDANGNTLNSQKFDGEWASNMVVDNSSNAIYMFGTYQSITEIDAITLIAFGGLELFLAKFNIQTVGVNTITKTTHQKPLIFPNPVDRDSYLTFEITDPSDIIIRMVDINGCIIKEILEGELAIGNYAIPLQLDKKTHPGLYFILFQSEIQTDCIKFIKP